MNQSRVFRVLMVAMVSFAVCVTALFGAGATDTSESAAEGPVPVTIYIGQFGSSNYDNFSTRHYEEKTNTEITVISAPTNELDTKLNVLMASNDRPDIIVYHLDQPEFRYAEAGVLVPISDYFDVAPELYESRKDVWDAMRHADGKIYAVTFLGWPVQHIHQYRKDWLDKLGLSVPTTIDEYYEVADAVSNRDPDGNGAKDTYAMGWPVEDLRGFDGVFGAYGTLPLYWFEDDGKLVNGSVRPGLKEGLKFLNRMYKEGMLDPEFITDNGTRLKQKFLNGVYGAMPYTFFTFDVNNLNNYYAPFKENNPDGELIEGPPLTAPGYEGVGFRRSPGRGYFKTAIVDNGDQAKIDAAIRLLEFSASEEGIFFQNYGLEGEHYVVENGVVRMIIDENTKAELGIRQLYLARTALYETCGPKFQEVKAKTVQYGQTNPADGIMIEEIAKYEHTLNEFTISKIYEMISGETPIEGGFESYVDEWYRRGGRELTDALNEAYQARK